MKGNKINWFDFLGIRVNLSNNREFKSFEEARKFVKTLNLKSGLEWRAYCKSDKKPEEIPYSPETTYKKEWKGWGDWLGTGRIANQDKTFKSFEEARKFVKTLNLKNNVEWRAYCKSGKKPEEIPADPKDVYKTEWINVGNWLGTGKIRNKNFKSFEEAREFVHNLNLKNGLEWLAYCKSGKKPEYIPYHPERTYKTEWVNLKDWLGTGNFRNKNFKSFEEARKFVKTLNLKNVKEWFAYCKSSSKPKYIPYHPEGIYDEWVNWGDWLGTGNTRNKDFKSFEKAKKFVQNLKLKNCSEWFIYCKSGSKPKDIPSNPKEKYKSEWKGYKDWLGTKK